MPDTRERAPSPRADAASPVSESAAEAWRLVVGYARQETIGPLRGLARWVAFGVAGSLMLSIGLVLLVLAGLRALQTETGDTFAGNWSWAPYGITFVVAVLVAALSLAAARRRRRP